MPAGMVTGLRGVDLGVPDVAARARFFTEVWRLSIAAERNGSVYLRGTGAYHHVLALHPRSTAQLLCINLAASSRAAVDQLHARLKQAGAAQLQAPRAIGEPGGGYGFAFMGPEKRVLRVIAGDARHADAAVLPDRPVKITHVVLNTPRHFVGPDDVVIEYTAEVERVDESYRVREPRDWAYPPGHSDLWGATPPPSARMKAAQSKIGFAAGLFQP